MLSISEVAEAIGRSASTVRRWERLGLIQPARRDPITNARRYSQKELEKLRQRVAPVEFRRTPQCS